MVATIPVVVDLPWVPATASTSRSAQTDASASPRWSTGTDASRAATTSGWSGGVAVDVTTASTTASAAGPRGPTVTSTPRSRSGARNGVSLSSTPETA